MLKNEQAVNKNIFRGFLISKFFFEGDRIYPF